MNPMSTDEAATRWSSQSDRELATAADLPPELFPLILRYLIAGDSNRRWVPEFAGDSVRRDLFAVSLTCRYWAEQCRPRLFASLSLGTKEHLYGLSNLLDQAFYSLTEVAPITAHLQTLLVIPVAGTPPWIHLVSSVLRPKIPETVSVYLALEASRFSPSQAQAIHSIHHSLPKSLPSLYSYFHSLYLADVHFRDVTDFARLIGEVPVLRQLRCHRLTWDKSTRSQEAWQRIKHPRCLESVQAEECTDNWVLLFLFARQTQALQSVEGIIPVRAMSQEYKLTWDDLQGGSEMIQACQRVSPHGDNASSNAITISASRWNTQGGYDLSHTATGFDSTPYHPPDITFGIEFEFPTFDRSSINLRSSITASRVSHIVTVVFDLVPSARWCWHPWDCDWEHVAELGLQLPRLQRVVLGFVSKSNLDRFANKPYGVALAKFAQSGKLHYAYAATGQDHEGKRDVQWVGVDALTLQREEPNVLYDRLVDVGLGHEESKRRGSTVSRLSRAAARTSMMTGVS